MGDIGDESLLDEQPSDCMATVSAVVGSGSKRSCSRSAARRPYRIRIRRLNRPGMSGDSPDSPGRFSLVRLDRKVGLRMMRADRSVGRC